MPAFRRQPIFVYFAYSLFQDLPKIGDNQQDPRFELHASKEVLESITRNLY